MKKILSVSNAGSAVLLCVVTAAAAVIFVVSHPASLFRLPVDFALMLQQLVLGIKAFPAYRAVLQYPELYQRSTIELKRH